MDPVQKQTHMSAEQHREPRNEPTLIQAINLQQEKREYTMGKIQPPQWIMLGNWTATCKRIKLAYFLRLCTKTSQEWFQDLNVRPETTKLIEENIGSKLLDIYLSNFFLYVSGKGDKSKINKWDYIKLKSFHAVKRTINKPERPHTEWQKDAFCLDSRMGPQGGEGSKGGDQGWKKEMKQNQLREGPC